MKAACVLLCLTLAHGITASIFKPEARQVDVFDVQQPYIQGRNTQESQENQRLYAQEQQEPQEQRDRKWSQQQRDYAPKQQVQSAYQLPEYQQYQQSQYRRVQNPEYSQEQGMPTRTQRSHKKHHNSYHSGSSESQERRYNDEVQKTQQQYPRKQYYQYNPSQEYEPQQQWAHSLTQQLEDLPLWMPLASTVLRRDSHVDTTYPDSAILMNQKSGSKAVLKQEQIFADAKKAMKQIPKEEQAKFHEKYEIAKYDSEEAELNATQLAQKHNYSIEEHTVKTDDGYVLTLFRIPPQKYIREVQKRPVVFLMHGILGSADDWLLMGPGKSLAYLLSDAGYDVWLGNARGNKYSRRHVSKHPAVDDFWQYSTDEIALHDLPSMIDYALKTTQQEKLFYIGHSLGTTAFFALTATQPEYNDKIIMMYALSPMVYLDNVRTPLFRFFAPMSQTQRIEQIYGNGEFVPSKEQIKTLGGNMLEDAIGCKKVSSSLNFVMTGVNVENMEPGMIAVAMHHLPAGVSTRVIKQYAQNVASHEFRRYDYGPQINMQVYGSEVPPKYEVSKVQVPVNLYYSEDDWLAHPQDVARLEKELPNVRETYKVPQEYFTSADFQFSTQAPEMVYSKLIESMEKQQ